MANLASIGQRPIIQRSRSVEPLFAATVALLLPVIPCAAHLASATRLAHDKFLGGDMNTGAGLASTAPRVTGTASRRP